MDEMKLKLTSKFMRGAVAKLISMLIRNKYGCKINIQINELDIDSINGETSISLSADAKLDSDEFKKIIKSIGLD